MATVIGRYHLYPYGTTAYASGGGDPNAHFTGHEQDPHGDAHYMLGRTYGDPLMRFTSVDPGRDGWNLYGYVAGNPVNKFDPTGREAVGIRQDIEIRDYLENGTSLSSQDPDLQKVGMVGAALLNPIPGPEDVLLVSAAGVGGKFFSGLASRLGLVRVVSEGASRVGEALKGLRSGHSSGVKIVDSAEDLDGLFDRLSSGGKAVESTTYPGRMVELPDGTTIGLRKGSKSGGPTIDIKLPDGTRQKVHVQQ